jgi:hypothetical protein
MKLEIDIIALAKSWGVTPEEYSESVSGSTCAGLMELKVAKELNGRRMGGEQLPYDVIANSRKNKLVEVRSICSSAASFAPSTATGKGRFFCETDFYKKVEDCDSYVFCDLRDKLMKPVTLYEIDASEVLEMYETVKSVGFDKKLRRDIPKYYLSDSASMTQKRFFERFPYEEYALVA